MIYDSVFTSGTEENLLFLETGRLHCNVTYKKRIQGEHTFLRLFTTLTETRRAPGVSTGGVKEARKTRV